MPDSTESKADIPAADTLTADIPPRKREASGKAAAALYIPRPRTMGFFVTLITLLAFAAGGLRNELVLTLLGTVFLIILAYCFLGVFLSGLIYRGKGRSLSLEIIPGIVSAGKNAELRVKTDGGFPPGKHYFLRLPAILIRSELRIETKDGRVIRHYLNPGFENSRAFPAAERGAYFSSPRSAEGDRFLISDAPGFFRVSFPLCQNEGPRLLVPPNPAEEIIPLPLKSGGASERGEERYRRSEELTDHRPYIPGDDPRRINWKLYGHAPLGELFVREGEPEPPPHSRLLVLVDTETDSSLYSGDDRRRAVDMLCENALASALEHSGRGTDILIGYTGGGITGGREENAPLNAEEIAAALARPWAVSRPGEARRGGKKPRGTAAAIREETSPRALLPPPPKDAAVLVFALPRIHASEAADPEASALDNFLQKREAGKEVDIVFLCDTNGKRASEQEKAARLCVNLYRRKSGVHVQAAIISGRQKGEGTR